MSPIIAAGFLGIEHFTPPWDIFFLPLFNLLVFVYRLPFFDFALAIIVFTIVIRTVLAPLFVKQIRSQKEMQRMQPLIKEVQRKHKGNRQKISEETMALYKEHGVNPAAGCLPVVLQLPILFALYQALIRASNVVTVPMERATSDAFAQLQAALPGITELSRTADNVLYAAPLNGPCNLPQFNTPDFSHFLPLNCQVIDPIKLSQPVDTTIGWLLGLDLAQIDHVFAIPIPGIGFALSLLAVIAAVLQFVQVRMTSQKPNPDDPTAGMTSTMTYTFPLLTIIWGGIFPSGLILYWIVYTAYLVVQQYLIMGWGNLFPLFGWTPSWAKSKIEADAAQRPKRVDTTDAPAESPQPSNPRATAPGGSRNNPRPQNRKQGGAKRRGRKR
ncbi:MAG TPA: YidC/Oxa1 family membrane protein insertase [Candidatus Limnocylindria bacterium]|nr:YidC/Oxa1 family membrane protein insertase [Candidatus Limnocylindria bacterium]